MKRIFTILMAVAVLGFVVAGCGGGSDSGGGSGSSGTSGKTGTDEKTGG
jgi:ABC-type glycerol-3-phosphate transport system substrate-binding protein